MRIAGDWRFDSDNYVKSVSFDIANDIIDFNNVPELLGYDRQSRTLKDENGNPYYDHWSDRYMKMDVNPDT